MSRKSFKHCPWCGEVLVDDPDGGPRRCGVCDYIHWNNPTPVVALIVETPEGVVLARNHGWPDGMWGVPTGFVEAGESPVDTARRELKEELNIDAEVELFDVIGFAPQNQVLIGYLVKTNETPVPGDDLAAIRHIPWEKLKPQPFGTGLLLKSFVERRRK